MKVQKPIRVPGFGVVHAPPSAPKKKREPSAEELADVHGPSYAQFLKWQATHQGKKKPKRRRKKAAKNAQRGESAANRSIGARTEAPKRRATKKKRAKKGKLSGAAKAAFLARMAKGRAAKSNTARRRKKR